MEQIKMVGAWFKANIISSDPENPTTQPLSYEELFRYSLTRPPFTSPQQNVDNGNTENGRPGGNAILPKNARKRAAPAKAPKVARPPPSSSSASASSSSSSSSSFEGGPAKRTRKSYTLKSDVQRQDEKYRLERAVNNESVRKTREKKKKLEEEEKRKIDLERSLLVKLVERLEAGNLVLEIGAEKVPEDLGVLNNEERALYQKMRRELADRLDS